MKISKMSTMSTTVGLVLDNPSVSECMASISRKNGGEILLSLMMENFSKLTNKILERINQFQCFHIKKSMVNLEKNGISSPLPVQQSL